MDAFLWTRSKPRGSHSSSYSFSTSFFRTVLPSQGIPSPSPLILLFLLGASPFFSFSSHPYSALSFLSQHFVTDERSYGDPFAARSTFGLTVPSRAMRLCKLNERDGRSAPSRKRNENAGFGPRLVSDLRQETALKLRRVNPV